MNVRIRLSGRDGPRTGCGGLFGRLFMTLFFLVFLGMGLFTLALVGRSILAEAATYRWQEVDCVIVTSTVEEVGGESPYEAQVRYRYVVGGREYVGDRIQLASPSHGSYSNAQAVASRYPPGTGATCLVDPEEPARAILEHSSPLLALFVLLPLIFVAVGGGGIFFVWRRGGGDESGTEARPTSMARRASRTSPAAILIAFGTVFLLIGVSVFYFLFVLPMTRLVQARSWVETPCEVIASEVRSHSSDDGTTYSVEILYEYRVEGRPYRSDRYRFTDWSSSGYDGKKAVVDRHPPGLSTVCYVDPSDPTRAVLDRDFHPAYLIGLFPLIFAVVGGAVLVWGVASRRKAAVAGPATAPTTTTASFAGTAVAAPGPLHLEPSASPVAKLVGMIFVCLFWNGIVSVFLWQLVSSWQKGDHQWGLALFLTPFVLVGLGLILGVGYTFLALFNPRPHLTLASNQLRLGDRTQLDWHFSGRAARIRQLTITLEGREAATYRRGTDTHTDHQVFHRALVVDSEHGLEIERGSRQVEIPDDSMHSFTASNNKIEWKLALKGDIDNWPDVNESFDLVVLPHPPEGPGR